MAEHPGRPNDLFQLIIPSYRASAGEQIPIGTLLTFTGGGTATTINGTI